MLIDYNSYFNDKAVSKIFKWEGVEWQGVVLKSDYWDYSIAARPANGLILEFGVEHGRTLNYIAQRIGDSKIYGFDSFQGLPEDWVLGNVKGSFKCDTPLVRDNVELVIGTFEETLPGFMEAHPEPISFMHIDCDLYSSTKTVFKYLGGRVVPGTIIMFDEYIGFSSWREHEYKAFQEFIAESGLTYEYLSRLDGGLQVSVRIA